MDQFDNRIKLDIFTSETTYQNDYKKFSFDQTERVSDCKKDFYDIKQIKPRECLYQDNETFVHWRKNVHIPFNLLWRPKEIINTDPYEPFHTPSTTPASADKEEAIKTRPRIYMSPAISMDDVDDPEMRSLLCAHMYTSEMTKAIQESAVRSAKRHIPNTIIEKGGDPVTVRLKVDLLPPLPDSFRNIGKKWEDSQLKSSVDPTKTFWEHKDPPVKCGACFDPVEGLVAQETKQKITELIKQDKLRLAHDAPIPGYAGYRPRFSFGVPLAKTDMPVVHPLLSVSQAITKRYAEDYSSE